MMTATELINKAEAICAIPTAYIWGGIGAPITEANLQKKLSQYPSSNANHVINARPLIGKGYMFDCVCLIKAILWGWTEESAKRNVVPYAKNGVPDITADGMIAKCSAVSTDFGKIVPGEVVWMTGHIGIYIGNGIAIECTPIWKNGVQKSAVLNIGAKSGMNGRKWTKHGKLPWVDYAQEAKVDDDLETAKKTIKDKADLTDATIKYLADYKYGKDLITKLANAMA